MDLIIRTDNFDINRIGIKDGKSTKKIIYNLDTLFIIGLSFNINNFFIVNQSKKYLYIDIDKSPEKDILINIDQHFHGNNKSYHSFIENYIIKIKKHHNNYIKNGDDLFISINNIKIKNAYSKIQLFTI